MGREAYSVIYHIYTATEPLLSGDLQLKSLLCQCLELMRSQLVEDYSKLAVQLLCL